MSLCLCLSDIQLNYLCAGVEFGWKVVRSTKKLGFVRFVCVCLVCHLLSGASKTGSRSFSFVTAASLDDVPHFLNIVDSREASIILTYSHSDHGNVQFLLHVNSISVNSVTPTQATFLI